MRLMLSQVGVGRGKGMGDIDQEFWVNQVCRKVHIYQKSMHAWGENLMWA
jgi:hypothetical protein